VRLQPWNCEEKRITRGSGRANSHIMSWSSAGSCENLGKHVARLILRVGCRSSLLVRRRVMTPVRDLMLYDSLKSQIEIGDGESWHRLAIKSSTGSGGHTWRLKGLGCKSAQSSGLALWC